MENLNRQNGDTFIGNLKKNWFIFVALAVLISTTAVNTSTMTTVEQKTKDHEDRIRVLEKSINQIPVIETKLDAMKEDQDEIKFYMKQILKAVK